MLYAINRLVTAGVSDDPRDVGKKKEVTIAKKRPASIVSEPWCEKTGIGELGRGQRILLAPIKLLVAQFLYLNRLDLYGDRRTALQ